MGRGALYAEVRQRVSSTVLATPPDSLTIVPPGTPDWTVRDVIAHLAGGAADIAEGNIAGAGTDEWTEPQVLNRRGLPLADLLDEWAEHSPAVESLLDQVPMAGLALADVATHEQDIAGALGIEVGRGSASYDAALQLFMGRLDERLLERGSGLTVKTESDEWVLGTGPAQCSASTTKHELFRAVAGRRSLAQIRSWDWTGSDDGAQWIPVLAAPSLNVSE